MTDMSWLFHNGNIELVLLRLLRLTLIIFSLRVRYRGPFSWAHAVKGGPVFTCFTNCRSELHLPASPGACIVPLPFHRAFS